MGKKKSSVSSSMKISKHDKKPELNHLMKILRPKVYITDTCNFKSLVQELTGNGKYPAAPTREVPLPETNQESMSCSSVAASVQASPELSLTAAREMEIYKGLEAILMEMDSDSCDYDNIACYDQMFKQDHQHQVCVYDYDLSNFV